MNRFKIYEELISSLKSDGVNSIYVHGIVEEATGHFIHTLTEYTNRPAFVVFENDKKALDNYEKFKNYSENTRYFPSIEFSFQDLENFDHLNQKHRLSAISAILEGKNPIVFASAEALMRKMADPEIFKNNITKIDSYSEIDPHELSKKLVRLGYQKRNIIQAKGEFSIRGDILDIFQVKDENPIRIEFFDTSIDSIRMFDINSQKSIDNLDEAIIYPIDENIVDFCDSTIIKKIESDLNNTRKKFKGDELDVIESKFQAIIEKLEEKMYSNIDLLIPYIQDNDACIFDYLSNEYMVIFEDISRIYEDSIGRESFLDSSINDAILSGSLLKGHANIYHRINELIALKINHLDKINVSVLLKRIRLLKIDKLIEIKTVEQDKYNGKFEDFIRTLKLRIENNSTQFIFSNTVENLLLIKDRLGEYDIFANERKNIHDFEVGRVNLLKSSLNEGFIYPSENFSVVTHFDIFGYQKKTAKKSKKVINQRDLINYTDLEPGDLVVHENYGVGKYLGIKNIEVNSSKVDYIEILYLNSDKLFIPTNEMHMISKFVGSGDKQPKLSKLNSVDWQKTKSRAKKSIDEIAENLVQLYAKRLKLKGFQFSEDTVWQKEFEESFIYEETGAQLRSIAEIKEDMESDKPMDRLLCGDVGYGKTEVALRAAFKAIMDGKQVVMLAPTTILVKQHFKTMADRFKHFPITIDYLSRFKSPTLKEDVKRKLKRGQIDFVVGTHAVLSKDVAFKDLGLLIVDEEQRFGVKHKEKIKEMSENIDSLTLSATPIPRTLQMSLSGIRDMSLLDEHPQNRLPINTYVMEFNPSVIREAILKEMSRNGQVYFVFNRVNGIYGIQSQLQQLIPEARIAVSHGRMSVSELENILEDFTNGEYDVLLTTTIIETGMDIQNVNTIIVYNADQMGLSTLYQLKGRIGRSERNSFAYFTYEKNKILTEVAEKRLKAIKDFNELGSGYKIAMRDLELRGAGNLLGESQSGHIEAIGYDLYVRMLKEAIDGIKGIKPKININVKIDLKISSFIPDKYISDQNEKINIYKKISFIENEHDYYEIIDELIDRFGDMPKSVQNILDVALIKALMTRANFTELNQLEKEVELVYPNLEIFNVFKLEKLAENYVGDLRFDLRNKPKILVRNDEKFVKNIINVLNEIDKINGGKNEKN